MEISFTMPSRSMISNYLREYWPEIPYGKNEDLDKFIGKSFSDIDRELTQEKRANVISAISLRALTGQESINYYEELSFNEKKAMVIKLYDQGLSQRAISAKLGISRPIVKRSIEDSLKE